MQYENTLFNTDTVHTIDIVIDDWQSFLDTCESEEYSICDVVIDGQSLQNIGIRGKGNTSLSSVRSMNSDRYSFKLEFDQYVKGGNYYGLDKLSLNNLIYDNTMMKDYLVFEMMREFGAAAPLCSYAYITVNGEDFGLYLAIEGIEDSFLTRNFGIDHGELYKPDTMNFGGGGRGNGKDFDMEAFINELPDNFDSATESGFRQIGKGGIPQWGNFGNASPQMPDREGEDDKKTFSPPDGDRGMGSSDVKLQYIDDDPDSYANIFDSAKTDITDADRERLISSLKTLSEGDDFSEVLDLDRVLRYFVVHNYAVNGDSYTGSMVHNYYLYEEDGKLSMLPWDYNLGFGTFQGHDAADSVNDPIDTPLSAGSSDRPMIDRILNDREGLELYHQYFAQFLETVDTQSIIDHAYTLIAPFVKKDPTKFCTYEEFTAGVDSLKTFCSLRNESIAGQLDGTIPATEEEQQAAASSLIAVGDLDLSAMGSMGMGGRNDRFAQRDMPGETETQAVPEDISMPEGMTIPEGMTMPENTDGGRRFAPRAQSSFPGVPSQSSASASDLLPVGVSLAFLMLAILFAKLYKRRK